MTHISLCLSAALCVASVCAVPSFPYSYPTAGENEEKSVNVVSGIPQYGYQLVPSNEYAVAEYYSPSGLDIWDYIPTPLAVIKTVVWKTWAVTKWVVAKGTFVLLGAALVLVFCGLSPFCTISFDKYPFIQHGYRSVIESSALSQVEDFVYAAIDKFKNLQSL